MNCPICQRPSDDRYRPFCSRRCADIDLGRWLTGSYAIPVTGDEDDPDEPGQPFPPATTGAAGKPH